VPDASADLPLTIHRAQSFWSRLGGLLVRPALCAHEALYLAPCASVHTAFMSYAIDVLFLDRAGKVLKVVAHLKPWRLAWCPGAHATLELRSGQAHRYLSRHRGATLVEAILVFPTLLFAVLVVLQTGFAYYAKSNLNYATFEAARAGSVNNASVSSITLAFQKALLPYYGGGTTEQELGDTARKAAGDLGNAALRIEILSPTKESFSDFNSPQLQAKLKTDQRVIPNSGLEQLQCPRDVPGCKSDPKTNASGQTLLDANLLKLRITYGIPKGKQMPLAGRFFTWALGKLGAGAGDAFKQGLIDAGRIPIVTHTVLRMQSDAIQNLAMVSNPGPGNDGKPVDPGTTPGGGELPSCPVTDPACVGITPVDPGSGGGGSTCP
jgi:uncharacterized membrane protein (UPF0127 family)